MSTTSGTANTLATYLPKLPATNFYGNRLRTGLECSIVELAIPTVLARMTPTIQVIQIILATRSILAILANVSFRPALREDDRVASHRQHTLMVKGRKPCTSKQISQAEVHDDPDRHRATEASCQVACRILCASADDPKPGA